MNANLIYDVGLHKGEDSEFYLSKGFRVLAIEAVPELCELARWRLRTFIDCGQLTILNVALTEIKGPLSFFVSGGPSAWGTANRKWAEWYRDVKGIQFTETSVPGIRFSEVLEEFGMPHYLKVDIEGADILCLRGLLSFSERPRYVSIETSLRPCGTSIPNCPYFKHLGIRNSNSLNS